MRDDAEGTWRRRETGSAGLWGGGAERGRCERDAVDSSSSYGSDSLCSGREGE